MRLSVLYLGIDCWARSRLYSFKLGGQLALNLGAVLSLCLAIGVLVLHPRLRAAAGLTWRQRSGSALVSIGLALAAFAAAFVQASGEGRAPRPLVEVLGAGIGASLTEELVYRGFTFGALCLAFSSRGVLWPILISTTGFALIHGVVWSQGERIKIRGAESRKIQALRGTGYSRACPKKLKPRKRAGSRAKLGKYKGPKCRFCDKNGLYNVLFQVEWCAPYTI